MQLCELCFLLWFFVGCFLKSPLVAQQLEFSVVL